MEPIAEITFSASEDGRRGAAAVRGRLDARGAVEVRRRLLAWLGAHRPAELTLDASGVTRADLAGLAVLQELRIGRLAAGLEARVVGLRPELERALAAFPSAEALDRLEGTRRRPSLPAGLGEATLGLARNAREEVSFLGEVAAALPGALRAQRRPRWPELAGLLERAGADAVPIVAFVAFLTGLVIAFEAAQPFAQYGAQLFIADTIGISMTRELGPLMTAIVLAGRSGSAFAAELGTMKVNEELDALATMGLDPVRFLVLQRIAAMALVTPLLTAFAMAAGIAGGVLVMFALGFSRGAIWTELAQAVTAGNIAFGTVKGVVFGATIAAVGCQRGLATRHGASAVGEAATRAVVTVLVLVALLDALFAVIAYVLHP